MTKEQYKIICESTWGCIPKDKTWAMNSPLYKIMEQKLLKNKKQ